jgi:glycosyltransferase involved in cell wall biosynthesis
MNVELTALVLTYNEAPNLRRTLEQLTWLREVVVVDSFSTDETETIAKSFPNVRFIQRAFDNHTAQWNFGVDHCATPWVLALDADYVLSDELVRELQSLTPAADTAACFTRFKFCVHGHPLRASLYPPRAVLFRRDRCRYEPDGHTQLLKISGPTTELAGRILHDDRKPLARWLWAQSRYADLEVEKLTAAKLGELRVQDRLRKLIFIAPPFVLLYTLFARGVILDGWPGWYYVFQRTVAELILSLKLIEVRLAGGKK